jgi:hypothetical protein
MIVVDTSVVPAVRVSGLDETDFTFQLSDPSNADISGTTSISINELGSSGAYEGSFTLPLPQGEYTLTLSHPTYFPATGKTVTFLAYVTQFGDSGDASAKIDFKVSDGFGQPVTGLTTTDFTWNIWNPSLAESSGLVPVTFVELGTGEYRALFDASSQQGKWFLDLLTVDDGAGGSYWTAGGKQAVYKYQLNSSEVAGQPTISDAVNDGNGTSVTLSLLADSAVDELFIYYRIPNAALWTLFGGSRTGSGDLQVTGLTNSNLYEFICIASRAGTPATNPSLPSVPVRVFVTDAAGTYTAIRQALYDWSSAQSPWTTYWKMPNAPTPALPNVAIRMMATDAIGEDSHSGPNSSGVDTIVGDREFAFRAEVIGNYSPDGEDLALTYAEQIASSLQKQSVLDTLAVAGIAYVDRLPIQDLTATVSIKYVARYLVEIRFRIANLMTDTINWIDTADPPSGTLVP